VLTYKELRAIFFISLYELFYYSLLPIIFLVSKFSHNLSRQLHHRSVSNSEIDIIKKRRARYQKSIIFHCSSAGEYEQIKPLVNYLLARSDTYVHIFFLSYSGLNFAKIKNEGASVSICPHDFRKNWNKLITAIEPDLAIVVRYELWPGFLYTVHKQAKLWLVNYNQDSNSKLSQLLQKPLLLFFDRVYTTKNSNQTGDTRYIYCGDTKFDRAYDNFIIRKSQPSKVSQDFFDYTISKTLVGGSVWRQDVEVILSAYNQLDNTSKKETNIIFVPHDLSDKNIQKIKHACLAYGLNTQIYYSAGQKIEPNTQVVIVNTMGMLTEIYSYGSLAFVGGAFHHKVHNTLEPAAFNLPIAFGPRYLSQAEASKLIEENIAVAVANAKELSKWWIDNLKKDKDNKRESILK